MIVNSEIKEHRIQESLSMWIKGKREAERQYNGRKVSMFKVWGRAWKEYWRIIITKETNIKIKCFLKY